MRQVRLWPWNRPLPLPTTPCSRPAASWKINPQHELFSKLTAVHDQGKDSQSFKDYCNLLYDQALLLEGIMPDDPVAFANKVASLMAK
mgnify:CR=1 FL=1